MTPPAPPTGPSESGDVKATVAVLSFILSSAAKHSVDGESLSSELQQLGLPKGTGCGLAAGQPVGQGLLERGQALRCTLPCLGQEPKPSPHLLPPELLHSTPRARGQPVPLL